MVEYIYGPVPSRRLGFSLGVDLVPFKTCSYDCIYCQLGKTTNKTLERKEYFPEREILVQLKKAISLHQKIDYITFSGSGEPTLNSKIGSLIRKIKKITKIPVAVLTNGSLFYQKELRKELLLADLVIPSLDAVTPEIFRKVNRPHSLIKVEEIIEGIKKFRKEFKGLIWLEIMLAKGFNDGKEHLDKIVSIVQEIKPDKIHLNTVVRPPTEKFALPLFSEELSEIKKLFGKNCEIIAEFKPREQKTYSEDLKTAILSIIKRRPVSLLDLSISLGKNQSEILKYLDFLVQNGKIKVVHYHGIKYYEIN
ncbi:radical SAM protein [Candidatus Aminicenantes bacterium AC-335-L06]|nr:radical SAM protein [Candidatus Aminicenantes bacterium AC-335-L06]